MTDNVLEFERQITKLHNEMRMFESTAWVIGTAKDSHAVRKRLERKRNDINRILGSMQTTMNDVSARGSSGNANLFEKLKKEFLSIKQSFEYCDAEARAKERAHVLALEPTETANHSRSGNSAALDMQFAEEKLRVYDTGDFETESKIQREKAVEILRLEQDLGELNSAYMEFNSVVKEQAGGLNKIEENTSNAVQSVEAGVTELKEARTQQRKGRKLMCIIVSVVIVIVVIILLVIFLRK